MDLFDLAERRVEDTSLLAYAKVRETLPEKDLAMCLYVEEYCREKHREDVTGWELATYLGKAVTSVRPALTRAFNAGWLLKGEIRASWVKEEGACHGYKISVPTQAIERAIVDQLRAKIVAKEPTNRGKINADSEGVVAPPSPTTSRTHLEESQGHTSGIAKFNAADPQPQI